MIIPETHRCDAIGCEALHGKTNGWWALIKDHEGVVHAYPYVVAERRGLLPMAEVYCGAGHVHPALSALMGGEV